ncbi:MAG: hypothetical protein WCG25_08510 [bacterium]
MKSLIEFLGIISENSLSFQFDNILYSESLNESVHTNINFLLLSSILDFNNIHVKTGLKFLSVTAYSTFSIH